LYKAEPYGTENIFHIGQISALYKIINNTDYSSGRDYRICSHWANFRLIQVPPYTSFTVVPMLSPSRFTTAYARSWCVPLNVSLTCFSWTFLKQTWKAVAIKHLLVLDHSVYKNYQHVSFIPILISLTKFMGTQNSMRILYNISLLTES
jgi:hypothetical protein